MIHNSKFCYHINNIKLFYKMKNDNASFYDQKIASFNNYKNKAKTDLYL